MNRASLKFNDPKIERDFSLQSLTLKYQMFLILNLIVFMGCLGQLYLALQKSDKSRLVVSIINCSYCLLSQLISYYKRSQAENCLIVLNILITIIQLTVTEPSQGYMYATCITMGQFTIIMACEFHKAAPQVFIIVILKILIYVYQYNDLDVSVVMALPTLFLMSIFCLYKVNESRRQTYLLTLKDTQYSQILQHLISKSFILFHYNPLNLSFNLDISQGQVKTETELKEFLRTASIQGQTLENYIFHRKGDQINQEKIQISYLKRHHQITHSQFNNSQLNILIIFQEGNKLITQEQHRAKLKYVSQKLLKLLKFQNGQFKLALKTKQFQIINQQRILNYQLILQLCLKYLQLRIEPINIVSIIKKVSAYFIDKNVMILTDNESKYINSIKEYLILLFIHYIKHFQSPVIQIECNINRNKEFIIKFCGLKYMESSNLLPIVHMALIKSLQINLIEDKTEIEITLHQEPFTNFI